MNKLVVNHKSSKYLVAVGILFLSTVLLGQTQRRFIGNANTTTDVTKLQSRPRMPYVIFLKFDPAKNASDEVKRTTWEQISDDWIMFKVNVTTDQAVFDAMDPKQRLRCYFTTFFAAGGGSYDPATGIRTATINMDVNPIADNGNHNLFSTPSHEIGHTFDLMHDNSNISYYGGHGEWGAIMGSGGGPVTHWSKGEYYMAGNPQDDIALLGAQLGFVDDDYPGTTTLTIEPNGTVLETKNHGTITDRNDIDIFKFDVPANGTINLTADPSLLYPNLDIGLTLKDPNGNIVATNAPVGKRTATINETVTLAGTYCLEIDGVGELNPQTGWSDYASLGFYEIGGLITGVVEFTDDLELTQIDGFGDICGSSINPIITVKNNGTNTITSFDANIYIDGIFSKKETVSTLLTKGNGALFTLSPITITGKHNVEIKVDLPGGVDQLDFNNSKSSSFSLNPGEALRFTTNFMDFDGKTPFTWSVSRTGGGSEIANSQNTSVVTNSDNTVSQTTCVTPGCYSVEVISSGQSCDSYTEYSGGNYSGGDVVVLDGQLYEAKWWTQNPTSHGDWDKLGPCLPGSAYVKISNPNQDEEYFNLSAKAIYPKFEDDICINSCNGPGTVTIVESSTNSSGPFNICGGSIVSIKTSITNSGNFNYNLYKGGSLQTTNNSGDFTLSSDGNYYVEVVNTTDASCSQKSNSIVINEAVLSPPNFSVFRDDICQGDNDVNYTANTQTGVTYTWAYSGNGATINGTDENISINYSNSATSGTLKVEVGNGCLTESTDLAITVNDCIELIASFSSDKTKICAGDTITYTSNSSGITTNTQYKWNFGTGAIPVTATGVGPHKIVYNSNGNPNVNLSLTDGVKIDDSLSTGLIQINETPSITIDGVTDVCENIDQLYSLNSTTTLSNNLWTISGNGSISGSANNETLQIAFGKKGIDTIRVQGASVQGCQSNTSELIVNIDECPELIASFTADKTSICSGQQITFTSTSQNVNSSAAYTWNFGSNASPTSATGVGPHTVAFSIGGTATISLSVVFGGENDDTTATSLITISDLPNPSIAGKNSVCENANNQIYSVNPINTGSTYSWGTTGNVNITSVQNIESTVVDFNTIGLANIQVTETTVNGCIGQANSDITINDCTVITAKFGSSQSEICSGDTVVFTNESTGTTTNAVYSWDFGLNASPTTATGIGPHQITYTGTGLASVSLSIVDGSKNDDTASTNQIQINALPNLIGKGDIISCVNTTPLDLSSHISPQGGIYVGPNINGSLYNQSVATSSTAVYSFIDNNNCKSDLSFNIEINANPKVTVLDTEVCELDNTTTLFGNPAGGVFSGTGISGSNFDPKSGTQLITYTYTDINGCKDSSNFTVTVHQSIPAFIELIPITSSICPGGNLEVSINQNSLSGNISGTQYAWYIENNLISGPNSLEKYNSNTLNNGEKVKVKMIIPTGNCVALQEIESNELIVQVDDNVIPVLSSNRSDLCLNNIDPINMTVNDQNGSSPNWEWLLDGVFIGTGSNIKIELPGKVVVQSTSGCAIGSTDSIEITSTKIKTENLEINPKRVLVNEDIKLEVMTPQSTYNYDWYINQNIQTNTTNSLNYTVSEEIGFIPVLVTISKGNCSIEKESQFEVYQEIKIPNVFTPNGDEVQDLWQLIGFEGNDYDLKIYNRWGNLVFQTNNTNEFWDGMFKGQNSPSGTYYYSINITSEYRQEKAYTGTVELIR